MNRLDELRQDAQRLERQLDELQQQEKALEVFEDTYLEYENLSLRTELNMEMSISPQAVNAQLQEGLFQIRNSRRILRNQIEDEREELRRDKWMIEGRLEENIYAQNRAQEMMRDEHGN